MKHFLLVLACCSVFFGCGQKRPAVVEFPTFDIWNSSTVEIRKIEMYDSVTILHMDAFFYPKSWIMIAKETYIKDSNSDTKFLITRAEGINLGEHTFMPDSGHIVFKLFFPPLPKEITKIDFIESDCPDCFKTWGINLLPKTKVTFDPIPPEFVNASIEPLPAPVYSMQPARVSGQLLGYKKEMGFSEVNLSGADLLTLSKKETKFPIADNGSFNGEAYIGFPSLVPSSIGNMFLIPGKEVKICVDLKKKSRYQSRLRKDKEPDDALYTYFSGSCFSASDILAIQEFRPIDRDAIIKDMENMTPEEYKTYVINLMNQKLNEIKQSNKPLSANAQILMEQFLIEETIECLLRYENFMTISYMRRNNIRDMSQLNFVPEKPNMEYYTFLNGMIDDKMAYLPYYPNLTAMLGSMPAFNFPVSGQAKSPKERFSYFKEKITPFLGTDHGNLFDVIQAQLYGRQIETMKFFTEAEKSELKNIFKDHPVYAEALIAANDQVETNIFLARQKNKESVVHETPAVSEEKMFDAILVNYKGKAILVDVWATWCQPCIQAFQLMKPLKEDMKNKNMVFLYITGETSPLAPWTTMVPDLHGEHYRVSNDQWGYWYKSLGIEGIPTYFVYDKTGKRTAKYTGFPGVATLKKDLEAAM